MIKKISLTILIILVMLGVQLSADQKDTGLKGFIKYLNMNQEELGFNSYGLLEHKDKIDVKIYLSKENVETLKTLINKYSYSNVVYGETLNSGSNDTVITVSFAKISQKKTEEEKPELKIDDKIEAKVSDEKKESAVEKVVKKKKIVDTDKSVKTKDKKKCPRRVKVEVAPVDVKLFNIYKKFNLTIAPSNETEIKAVSSGTISEVLVENGDMVEENQLIAKLDSSIVKEALNELKAKLKTWKSNLFKREHWKVRSPKAEENAKKIIAETIQLIEEKDQELLGMNIKATMSGNVFHSLAVEDDVEKETVIGKIVNSKKMRIMIPASDENLFKINEMVNLKFENISALYSGKVLQIDSGLMIEIENSNDELKKGMMASFKVIKEVVENAVVIKTDWMLTDENGPFVYVVNGKRAQKVYVTVKATDEIKKESLIKSGLLKEDEIIITNLDCISDQKKIKVMVLDPATGELIKRKKKSSKVKPESIERREIKKIQKVLKDQPKTKTEMAIIDGNFLRLNLGAGYHYISDSIFAEIYGNGMVSGRFGLSYTIKNKFEIFLEMDYISKAGFTIGLNEDVTMNMIPIYFGGRYNFQTKGKIKPFAGIAFVSYAVKEKSDEAETAYLTDNGVSLVTGFNMNLTPKLDLFFHLKYDAIKLTTEAFEDDKLDVSGVSIFVGVSYKFKL